MLEPESVHHRPDFALATERLKPLSSGSVEEGVKPLSGLIEHHQDDWLLPCFKLYCIAFGANGEFVDLVADVAARFVYPISPSSVPAHWRQPFLLKRW